MRHTSHQTRHGHFQRTPQPPADSTTDKVVRFAQRAQAVAGAVQKEILTRYLKQETPLAVG